MGGSTLSNRISWLGGECYSRNWVVGVNDGHGSTSAEAFGDSILIGDTIMFGDTILIVIGEYSSVFSATHQRVGDRSVKGLLFTDRILTPGRPQPPQPQPQPQPRPQSRARSWARISVAVERVGSTVVAVGGECEAQNGLRYCRDALEGKV